MIRHFLGTLSVNDAAMLLAKKSPAKSSGQVSVENEVRQGNRVIVKGLFLVANQADLKRVIQDKKSAAGK